MDDSDLDGIECLREALERMPELSAIVLSMRCDPRVVDAALDAGAFAHVAKSVAPGRVGRDRAGRARNLVRRRNAVDPAERPSRLTRREREILQLVAEGHSNAQLAKLLWVTEQTVKFHLSNIYRKLDVSNRTEAARWAQVNGLLETGQPGSGRAGSCRLTDSETSETVSGPRT